MQSKNAEPKSKGIWFGTWRRKAALAVTVIAIMAGVAYLARVSLLLNVARIALNRDADLIRAGTSRHAGNCISTSTAGVDISNEEPDERTSGIQ